MGMFPSQQKRRYIANIYPVLDCQEPYLRVYFTSGEQLQVPIVKFKRLVGASLDQLLRYRLFANDRAVSWEELDEDIHVSGLIRAAVEEELEAQDATVVEWQTR